MEGVIVLGGIVIVILTFIISLIFDLEEGGIVLFLFLVGGFGTVLGVNWDDMSKATEEVATEQVAVEEVVEKTTAGTAEHANKGLPTAPVATPSFSNGWKWMPCENKGHYLICEHVYATSDLQLSFKYLCEKNDLEPSKYACEPY